MNIFGDPSEGGLRGNESASQAHTDTRSSVHAWHPQQTSRIWAVAACTCADPGIPTRQKQRAMRSLYPSTHSTHVCCNQLTNRSTVGGLVAARLVCPRFCFCPRGDTASSRRIFDALAAGCIPIVTENGKRVLPFVGYASGDKCSEPTFSFADDLHHLDVDVL